jgi:hypothetical protein
MNQTIYWNPPQNDTTTKVYVLIQKFGNDITVPDSVWSISLIPLPDNGTFTLSTSYFNRFGDYKTGDKIKIDIFRVKSEVETYDGKKYLFAALFDTHLILYVK